MRTSGENDLPSGDAYGGGDPERTPRWLEAMIEHADGHYGAESIGTTGRGREEGESLDQRLSEELPDSRTSDVRLAMKTDAAEDDEGELIGEASLEHDPSSRPKEAAMTIRKRAAGAVDDPGR